MRSTDPHRCLLPALLLAALALPACKNSQEFKWPKWGQWMERPADPCAAAPVPYPISLMLPKTLSIHPFTGMRTFDDSGGVKGIDVRIEAKDSYGDTTRAFGDYRFELYTFRPNSLDPKNNRIAAWDVPLTDPGVNGRHWDNITRTYKFRLQWDQSIAVGQRFVLVAVFSSPHTERLFAERVFVAGE